MRPTTNNRARQFAAALLALCAPMGAAHAQRQAPTDGSTCSASAPVLAGNRADSSARGASSPRAQTDARSADVIIYAAASVGELRFATQPDLRVRLCGGLDSIHVLERRNLPTPVVAGTTYRDVYVAVQIFGRLTADCLRQTLEAGARADSTRNDARLNCASLELRGAHAPANRPPADTAHPPWR